MTTHAPTFESLLERMTEDQTLEPLLCALGFDPPLVRLEPGECTALGIVDERAVHCVYTANERGGLRVLVIELNGSSSSDTVRLARRVRANDATRTHLFIFAEERYRRLTLASFGLGHELRRLVIDPQRLLRTDIEALEELVARDGEGGTALAVRHARALDRTLLTQRFFRDFKAQRARVADAWRDVPHATRQEREQLALLLLSRLLFLYFLQRRGQLTGDREYLPRRMRDWLRAKQSTAPHTVAHGATNGRDTECVGGERHLEHETLDPSTPISTVEAEGVGEDAEITTFYRSVLTPLFFGALNTRPEHRSAAAQALGPLPYLNGGLFEAHALERRFGRAELDDDVVAGIFDDLLERYRFTTREASYAEVEGAGDVGVDPEMLGRVFEGLMAPGQRSTSGTFYTPAPVVDRLTCEALEAWLSGATGLSADAIGRLVRDGDGRGLDPAQRAELRRRIERVHILDPACGSGAFLLGALSRLEGVRTLLTDEAPDHARREIIGHALHGVDIQEDAALLCALRLWLALSLDAEDSAGPPPLPNLDRRIRQGDALVDPLDLIGVDGFGLGVTGDANVVRALRQITPLASRYLSADPLERPALQDALRSAESTLASAWTDSLDRRLTMREAELRALAASRDLFGERPRSAAQAEAMLRDLAPRREELEELRATLEDDAGLPFFSFGIHFSEAAEHGFDLILSNPPWVRAHRWPASLGAQVRDRYSVCREPGWRYGARRNGSRSPAGGQVDLSLLFLERALRLLADDGALAMLLPAKALRSLYGGSARRMLVRESRLVSIEDHSLDQRSIFQADAFASSIVARKEHAEDRAGSVGPVVRVTMIRRGVEPLRFALEQDDLGVIPGDDAAPWLFAPPAARSALRKMQRAGRTIGEHSELRIRRGIVTGANDVLVVDHVEPKLAGLSWIQAHGYGRARRDGRPAIHADEYEALIETDTLRPLVRGSGIRAWSYAAPDHVIWVHDDVTGEPRPAPPRLGEYLERHQGRLRARRGSPDGHRGHGRIIGALMRLHPETLGPKVAWQDLAATLNAVVLPARARGADGGSVPLVPLNTVYYLPTDTEEEAMRLAALFNSLPVRTFARAVAERAKDARFRFMAWATTLIPLPHGWEYNATDDRLLHISQNAHEEGRITPAAQHELDTLVAKLYGLTNDDIEALNAFDRWLRGER